jgi:hypothetical protein
LRFLVFFLVSTGSANIINHVFCFVFLMQQHLVCALSSPCLSTGPTLKGATVALIYACILATVRSTMLARSLNACMSEIERDLSLHPDARNLDAEAIPDVRKACHKRIISQPPLL